MKKVVLVSGILLTGTLLGSSEVPSCDVAVDEVSTVCESPSSLNRCICLIKATGQGSCSAILCLLCCKDALAFLTKRTVCINNGELVSVPVENSRSSVSSFTWLMLLALLGRDYFCKSCNNFSVALWGEER